MIKIISSSIITIIIILILIIITILASSSSSSSSKYFVSAACPNLTPGASQEIEIPDFDGNVEGCPIITIEGITTGLAYITFNRISNVDAIIINDITCSANKASPYCVHFSSNDVTSLKSLTISNIHRPEVELPAVEDSVNKNDYSVVLFEKVSFQGDPFDLLSISNITIGKLSKPVAAGGADEPHDFSFVRFNQKNDVAAETIRIAGDFIIEGLRVFDPSLPASAPQPSPTNTVRDAGNGKRMSISGIFCVSTSGSPFDFFVGTTENSRMIWRNVHLNKIEATSSLSSMEVAGVIVEAVSGFGTVEISDIHVDNTKATCRDPTTTNQGCSLDVIAVKFENRIGARFITIRDVSLRKTQLKPATKVLVKGLHAFALVGVEKLLVDNVIVDGVQVQSFSSVLPQSNKVFAVQFQRGDTTSYNSDANNNNNNNNDLQVALFNNIRVDNVALFSSFQMELFIINALRFGANSDFIGFNQFNITHCSVSRISVIAPDTPLTVEVVSIGSNFSSNNEENNNNNNNDYNERSLFVQDLSLTILGKILTAKTVLCNTLSLSNITTELRPALTNMTSIIIQDLLLDEWDQINLPALYELDEAFFDENDIETTMNEIHYNANENEKTRQFEFNGVLFAQDSQVSFRETSSSSSSHNNHFEISNVTISNLVNISDAKSLVVQAVRLKKEIMNVVNFSIHHIFVQDVYAGLNKWETDWGDPPFRNLFVRLYCVRMGFEDQESPIVPLWSKVHCLVPSSSECTFKISDLTLKNSLVFPTTDLVVCVAQLWSTEVKYFERVSFERFDLLAISNDEFLMAGSGEFYGAQQKFIPIVMEMFLRVRNVSITPEQKILVDVTSVKPLDEVFIFTLAINEETLIDGYRPNFSSSSLISNNQYFLVQHHTMNIIAICTGVDSSNRPSLFATVWFHENTRSTTRVVNFTHVMFDNLHISHLFLQHPPSLTPRRSRVCVISVTGPAPSPPDYSHDHQSSSSSSSSSSFSSLTTLPSLTVTSILLTDFKFDWGNLEMTYGMYFHYPHRIFGFLDIYFADFIFRNMQIRSAGGDTSISGLSTRPFVGPNDVEIFAKSSGVKRFDRLGRIDQFQFDYFLDEHNNNNNNDEIARGPSLIFRDFHFSSIHMQSRLVAMSLRVLWLSSLRTNFLIWSFSRVTLRNSSLAVVGTGECPASKSCSALASALFFDGSSQIRFSESMRTGNESESAIATLDHMIASSAIFSVRDVIVDSVTVDGKNEEAPTRVEIQIAAVSEVYAVKHEGTLEGFSSNITISNVHVSNSASRTASVGSVRLMAVRLRDSTRTPNFHFQHISSIDNQLFSDGPVHADLIMFNGTEFLSVTDVNLLVVRDCFLAGTRATSLGHRTQRNEDSQHAITSNLFTMRPYFYGDTRRCAFDHNNTFIFDNLTIDDIFLNMSTDYQKYDSPLFYVEAFIFITNSLNYFYFYDLNLLNFTRLTVSNVVAKSYMYNSNGNDREKFKWNDNWVRKILVGGINLDRGLRMSWAVFKLNPLAQFDIFVNDVVISNIDTRSVVPYDANGDRIDVGRGATAEVHGAIARALFGIRTFSVANVVTENIFLYSDTSFCWVTTLLMNGDAEALAPEANLLSRQDKENLTSEQRNSIRSKLPFESVMQIQNVLIRNTTIASYIDTRTNFATLSPMYIRQMPDQYSRMSSYILDNVSGVDLSILSDRAGALATMIRMMDAPYIKIPASVSHDVPSDDPSYPTSLLSTYGVTKLEVLVNNCFLSNVEAQSMVVSETSLVFFLNFLSAPFTKISATNSKIEDVTLTGSSTFAGAVIALAGVMVNVSEIYVSDVDILDIKTIGVYRDKPITPAVDPLGAKQMIAIFGFDGQNTLYDANDGPFPYHQDPSSFLLIIDKITIGNINISRDMNLDYFSKNNQPINYYLDPRYVKSYITCLIFQGTSTLIFSPFPMNPLPLHIKTAVLEDTAITHLNDDSTLPSLQGQIAGGRVPSIIAFVIQENTAKEIIIDEKMSVARNRVHFGGPGGPSSKQPFSSVAAIAMKRISSSRNSNSDESQNVIDIIGNSVTGIDASVLSSTFMSIIFFNTTTVLSDASTHHRLSFFVDQNSLPRQLKSATIFGASDSVDDADTIIPSALLSSELLQFPKFSFDIPCHTNRWNSALIPKFEKEVIKLREFEDTDLQHCLSTTQSVILPPTKSTSRSLSQSRTDKPFDPNAFAKQTASLINAAKTTATVSSFTQLSSAGAMSSAMRTRAVLSSIEKIAVGKCGLSYEEVNDEARDPSVSPLQLHLGEGGGFAAGLVVGDVIATALMMVLFVGGYWLLNKFVISKYDDDDDQNNEKDDEDDDGPSTSQLPDWQRLIIDSKSLSMLQIVAILFFEPIMTNTLSIIALGSEMKIIWKIVCSIICIAFLAFSSYIFYKLLVLRKGTYDTFVTNGQRTPEQLTDIRFLHPLAALFLYVMEPEGTWNFDSSKSKEKSIFDKNNNRNDKQRKSSKGNNTASAVAEQRVIIQSEFLQFKLTEPLLESYTNRLGWFLPVEYAVLFVGFSLSTFISALTSDCLPLTILISLSLLIHLLITIIRRPNVERLIHIGSILVSVCCISLTIAAFVLGRLYDFGGYFETDNNGAPPIGVSDEDFAAAIEERNNLLHLIGILSMVLSCIQVPVSLLSLIGFLESGVYQELRALFKKIFSKKEGNKRRGQEGGYNHKFGDNNNNNNNNMYADDDNILEEELMIRDKTRNHHRQPSSSVTRQSGSMMKQDEERKSDRDRRHQGSSSSHRRESRDTPTESRRINYGDDRRTSSRSANRHDNHHHHNHSKRRVESDLNLLRREDMMMVKPSTSSRTTRKTTDDDGRTKSSNSKSHHPSYHDKNTQDRYSSSGRDDTKHQERPSSSSQRYQQQQRDDRRPRVLSPTGSPHHHRSSSGRREKSSSDEITRESGISSDEVLLLNNNNKYGKLIGTPSSSPTRSATTSKGDRHQQQEQRPRSNDRLDHHHRQRDHSSSSSHQNPHHQPRSNRSNNDARRSSSTRREEPRDDIRRNRNHTVDPLRSSSSLRRSSNNYYIDERKSRHRSNKFEDI